MSNKSSLNRNLSRIHTPEGVRAVATQVSGQLDTANTNITTLQGNVTTLQGQMTTAQGNITTLQTNVTSLQGVSWDSLVKVSSSDFTTSSTSLVDITGLSVALLINSVYEFESVLIIVSSENVNGVQLGVNYSVAGGSVAAQSLYHVAGGSLSGDGISTLNSAGTATGATTASAGIIKGFLTTGANAGNLTMKILKVTSGTATVKIGSVLKVKKVG